MGQITTRPFLLAYPQAKVHDGGGQKDETASQGCALSYLRK